MVGNFQRPDSTSGGTGQVGQNQSILILSSDHNISPTTIRRIIQDSLNPLPVNPIPTTVVISNIVITRNQRGELGICCEVSYGVEVNRGR